jgi:hypothetical protein
VFDHVADEVVGRPQRLVVDAAPAEHHGARLEAGVAQRRVGRSRQLHEGVAARGHGDHVAASLPGRLDAHQGILDHHAASRWNTELARGPQVRVGSGLLRHGRVIVAHHQVTVTENAAVVEHLAHIRRRIVGHERDRQPARPGGLQNLRDTFMYRRGHLTAVALVPLSQVRQDSGWQLSTRRFGHPSPELRNVIREVGADDRSRHLPAVPGVLGEKPADELVVHRERVDQHAVHVDQQRSHVVGQGQPVRQEHGRYTNRRGFGVPARTSR